MYKVSTQKNENDKLTKISLFKRATALSPLCDCLPSPVACLLPHSLTHTPTPCHVLLLRMAMDLLPDGSLGLYPCATPPQPCAQHNAWPAVSNPGRCDEKQRRRSHLGLHPGAPRFSHRTLRGMRELGQLGADNGSSSQLRCTPQHSAWV